MSFQDNCGSEEDISIHANPSLDTELGASNRWDLGLSHLGKGGWYFFNVGRTVKQISVD